MIHLVTKPECIWTLLRPIFQHIQRMHGSPALLHMQHKVINAHHFPGVHRLLSATHLQLSVVAELVVVVEVELVDVEGEFEQEGSEFEFGGEELVDLVREQAAH
jgi:hypothetical protein